jgi:hypothetical protein
MPTLFQLRERLARFEALMVNRYGKEYTRCYLVTERDQHNNLRKAVADKRETLYAQYNEALTEAIAEDADITGVTAADLLNSSK